MKSQILAISIISIAFLSGCFGPKAIDVKVKEVPREPLALPLIDKFDPNPLYWYIVTEDNAQDVFDQLKKDGTDPVIFGLTDEGYEDISLNQAKMLKLMIQLQATTKAMEDYYNDDTGDTLNGNSNTTNGTSK